MGSKMRWHAAASVPAGSVTADGRVVNGGGGVSCITVDHHPILVNLATSVMQALNLTPGVTSCKKSQGQSVILWHMQVHRRHRNLQKHGRRAASPHDACTNMFECSI
jgi:hypothetical protein